MCYFCIFCHLFEGKMSLLHNFIYIWDILEKQIYQLLMKNFLFIQKLQGDIPLKCMLIKYSYLINWRVLNLYSISGLNLDAKICFIFISFFLSFFLFSIFLRPSVFSYRPIYTRVTGGNVWRSLNYERHHVSDRG